MRSPSAARWLWLSTGVLAADRGTKYAIERNTSLWFRQPILSDVVTLVHNQNPGMAFSWLSESHSPWLSPILLLSSLAVIILLVWILVSGRAGGWIANCGLALILGGAAGNALDRLMYGAVTDFLDVRLGSYHWPAFNVADSAITVGAVFVIVELFFFGHKPDSAQSKAANGN